MKILPIGFALRRYRRLSAIKQGHVAELLGVSQGSVSRWESGRHEPSPAQRVRLVELIRTRADESSDSALKRLIATSTASVHLICDTTHALLAASPSRAAEWSDNAGSHLGRSLWRFATPQIESAELTLAGLGWFDLDIGSVEFDTAGNGSAEVPILAGRIRWDKLQLAYGRIGRLVTAIT